MTKKKVDADVLSELLDDFESNVKPWCMENGFTLHQAFEESRTNDLKKYKTLSGLWHTYAGKEYLQSAFSGGKLRDGKRC